MERENYSPEGEEGSKKQKIVFADVSQAVGEEARDAAEAKLTESAEELRTQSGFKTWAKRIWKHNLWREVIRQREIAAARKEIQETGNIYAAQTSDKSSHDEAMQAIVERFSSEYEDALHQGATAEDSEVKGVMANPEVSKQVKDLIVAYAKGEVDDASFEEEKVRIFSAITGASKGLVDRGEMFATNLKEIARQTKLAVEHGKAIEDLDLDFEIIVGRAKTGVRTQAQFNTVDRITEKIMHSRIGKYVNETTAASAVAIAHTVGSGLSQRIARSRVAAWGTFGMSAVVGGGIAGAKESARLEEERRQHFREAARGKKFDFEHAPRRAELEHFRYETRSSDDLLHELQDATREAHMNKEGFRRATKILTEIETRIRLSDRHDIDLVSYSEATKVEQERFALDVARAEAKITLAKIVDTKDKQLEFLGVEMNLKDFLDKEREVLEMEMLKGESGIEQKNRFFKKMKHKKVAKAVIKGVFTGLAVGTVAQEVGAFFNDKRVGLLEQTVKGFWHGTNGVHEGAVHYTALEYLHQWAAGKLHNVVDYDAHLHGQLIGARHFKIPDGMDLQHNTDGSWSLLQNGEVVGPRIIQANGELVPKADSLLAEHGIFTSNYHEHVLSQHPAAPGGAEGVPPVAAEGHLPASAEAAAAAGPADHTLAPKEYMAEHGTHIRRQLWYDNDTPKVFEKNELRLHWGGAGENGIDQNGNYVFNVARMTPDGSYTGNFSTDAQELIHEGKMKMLLSMSRDSQNHVFEVPIDAHGNAVIDPNSEAGKLLFAVEHGHAVFKGKFAEAAQDMGAKDGVDRVRILATHIGKGIDHTEVAAAVPEGVVAAGPIAPEMVTEARHIPFTVFEGPKSYIVDPPPIIPIMGRRPLESDEEPVPIYYSSSGSGGAGSPERRRRSLSETLKRNPDAQLDPYKETEEYFSRQSPEYLEEIQGYAQEMGPMDDECEISVCIPVAGHQEGKNIYRTLENYTRQVDKKGNPLKPTRFEIVLFVNHPDLDLSGQKVKADQTLSEIERFRREHPEIKIRQAFKVLPKKDARIGRIRKLMNDTVLLRGLQNRKNVIDRILVSNDADSLGIDREYLNNFIEKFGTHPEVDSMLGQLEYGDPQTNINNPLLLATDRFLQYSEAGERHKKEWIGSSGANFAMHASIYASVGGYDPEVKGGEDSDIGERIRSARQGGSHTPIAYAGARASRIYTSARRAEEALEHGFSPAEQWNQIHFGAFDTIRTKARKEGKLLNFDNKQEVDKLVKDVETMINRMVRPNTIHGPYTRRALGWLGVKYRIVGDKIEITDASRMIEGMKRYRQEAEHVFAIKTKTGPRRRNEGAQAAREQEATDEEEATPPVATPPAERARENREQTGKETFSINEIKEIIRAQIGKKAKINRLDITPKSGGADLIAELDAGTLGGKIKLNGRIENSRDGLAIRNLKIDAGTIAKNRINNSIGSINEKLREFFEKRLKKDVKSLRIEGDRLIVETKNRGTADIDAQQRARRAARAATTGRVRA